MPAKFKSQQAQKKESRFKRLMLSKYFEPFIAIASFILLGYVVYNAIVSNVNAMTQPELISNLPEVNLNTNYYSNIVYSAATILVFLVLFWKRMKKRYLLLVTISLVNPKIWIIPAMLIFVYIFIRVMIKDPEWN
ncbi:hypothetical protein [Persicobacter diffluens]|uniref:Uncharacterized protein n=1 Tax=Persicobacter diffluens TaxID=981 RepID=A0AAN4W2M1_9BACT|nr:hypothetical protein PEDI_51560 [Persicobacter diffluens]